MNWNQWFRKTGQWLAGTGGESVATLATADQDAAHFDPTAPGAARRYASLLSPNGDGEAADDRRLAQAWQLLESEMALVPAGETSLIVPVVAAGEDASTRQRLVQRIRVQSVYMDRLAVTNADFTAFVEAGGYREPQYWPPQILPEVLQFTDRSGNPGPRHWQSGRPPQGKLNHPVVGISWFEARAYAIWIGKRLPTSAEWQRAACWCDTGGDERRYPWGNAFSPQRANTWLGGAGDTQPVSHYYEGCTPNGIYQLVGNVWEWTATAFDCECEDPACELSWDHPMAEIRGGAFDTYFETQATCQFRSGQPLLYRGSNLGFRCCLPAEGLRRPEHPAFFLNEP